MSQDPTLNSSSEQVDFGVTMASSCAEARGFYRNWRSLLRKRLNQHASGLLYVALTDNMVRRFFVDPH